MATVADPIKELLAFPRFYTRKVISRANIVNASVLFSISRMNYVVKFQLYKGSENHLSSMATHHGIRSDIRQTIDYHLWICLICLLVAFLTKPFCVLKVKDFVW